MADKEVTLVQEPAGEAGQDPPRHLSLVPDLDPSLLEPEAVPEVAESEKSEKAKPQELAETNPAPVGLAVGLVVTLVVAAVVVAMWLVSPLWALLLAVGLVGAAIVAGVGWVVWRRRRLGRGRSSPAGGARSGMVAAGPGPEEPGWWWCPVG